MSNDKDYNLDKDQLVTVCKILLHKINFNQRRLVEQDVGLRQHFLDNLNTSERSVKSSMEEVNQFLQSVHSDFETFLKRHQKERQEVNLKLQKLSEVAHKTLDNYDQVREPILSYATMLTCLIEFAWIEQSLQSDSSMSGSSLQHRDDGAPLKVV